MTPEEHNKRLGVLHLVYGGLNALLLAVATVVTLLTFNIIWNEPGHVAPSRAFLFMVIGVLALAPLLFVTPALVAGGALLKRKSWGRKAAIVAAILMALNFPFGTALAVYTLWFLLGKGGTQLYEDESVRFARYALGDAPPQPVSDWVETDRQREREKVYTPPAQPPDWR